jgi:transcriptional regulator with XRE-family HTH domain
MLISPDSQIDRTTTFGAWLRQKLRLREVNAAGLARRLDVRPGVVSHWINNKRAPSVPSCYAIADVLDLTPDQV